MTQDEAIKLAHEAGITFVKEFGVASATPEWITSFANLVLANRKPLTDEFIYEMWDNKYRSWVGGEQFESITRAIEAAHSITGGEA